MGPSAFSGSVLPNLNLLASADSTGHSYMTTAAKLQNIQQLKQQLSEVHRELSERQRRHDEELQQQRQMYEEMREQTRLHEERV